MTDVTGKNTDGAPRPRKTAAATPAVAPERRTITDPTPTDVGPSAQGDVASASAEADALREEESVLLAGLERAQSTASDLRAWAWLRQEEARDTVRTHPLASSVFVFGAGMIFGLLMARR